MMREKIQRKPRIGYLGIMQGDYEPIFPGIIAAQEKYAREVVADLADVVELDFPRAAVCREDIEAIVAEFNQKGCDGIMMTLLTYSAGMLSVRALMENNLPLLVACIQPSQRVDTEWEEYDLTVNQGMHGTQDNCNAILRMGIKCDYIVEDRTSESFKTRVAAWAYDAKTATALKRMKIGILCGRLRGMGDILMDDASFMRKLGPETVHDSPGLLCRYMAEVDEAELAARYAQDLETFEVDPKLTKENHFEAIRMYLAMKRLCEEKEYSAYTAHFDGFTYDGRFKQLPLYAASAMMADGYGYSAEGDVCCATLMAMGNYLCGNSNFTEMYTMDFDLDAVICCHAGEGNYSTATKRMKPRLIDRYLGEGGLDNPPTTLFLPEPGEATLVSLVAIQGDRFRLVVSHGEILDKLDMRRCEMPYLFYRPDNGIKTCVENWLRLGGTHHEVITQGDTRTRWKTLCNMLDIEYVEA